MFSHYVLLIVFGTSLVFKVRDFRSFRLGIEGFLLVPRPFIGAVAWLLLFGETSVVVCLTMRGALLRSGFFLAAFLLALFTTVLVITLNRGVETSCHCFGAGGRHIGPGDVLRTLVFLICALWGMRLSAPPAENMFGSAEKLIIALVAAVLVLFLTYLEDLLAALGLRPSRPRLHNR